MIFNEMHLFQIVAFVGLKNLPFSFMVRSSFKTPDQVQGQGVRPIGKAQHTWVCEHLPEACNAAIGP
jgi:hypothetical protein